MEIAEFLLARIAEDEAVARAALAWQRADPADRWRDSDEGALLDGQGEVMASYVGDDVAPHIARWDPTRVLAECKAKRRIVEAHPIRFDLSEYEQSYGGRTFGCPVCHDYDGITCGKGYCETLLALALPYANHEDYDEAWRP